MKLRIAHALLLGLLVAAPQSAPAQVGVEARVTGGAGWFLDDDSPTHMALGGGVRFKLPHRLGVEPEFLYLRGPGNDRDYVFAPQLTYDFVASRRRAIPFVSGGAGVLHHDGGRFSTTGFTAVGGVGVRLYVTERFFITPQFRLAIEPNAYWITTVSAGFRLSGR